MAQAILHEPDIVILDEPTNGLDPTQILQMRVLIRELALRATVIVSTHILQEVQAVCQRVVIMRSGRKELGGFFASPAAFLFLGAFLGVTLFVFFWVDTFFSRDLADVRQLFQWMPVLLIFLVAALTMRPWSEERRAGTLELLLTSPTSPHRRSRPTSKPPTQWRPDS